MPVCAVSQQSESSFSDSTTNTRFGRWRARRAALDRVRHNDAVRPVGGLSKRMFDIVVAGAGMVVATPLIIGAAIAVRLTSPGPIFFAHERVGCGGRPFKCFKIRTMMANGDQLLAEVLANDPAAAAEWAESRKLRNDPRVTRVGRFLRKTSLDELPQLLNILRGEMSVVGPRPIVEAELLRYGSDVHGYLRTRPGLTGSWQISGRSDLAYDARVKLDAQYVATWTLMRDILIVSKTVPAVMRARGSC